MNHRTPQHAHPVELHRPFHTVALMCAVIGVTAIALLGAAAWPGIAGDETPASAEPSPPPQADVDTAVPASGTDGELEIIEYGYTPMANLIGEPMVSWAAIVKNTSSTMTAVSTVYIEPYDTDGESLAEENDWDVAVSVANLMPGEEVGVGSTSYIDEGDFDGLDVRIGETEWFEPANSWLGEGTLVTSDIATEWVNIGEKENYWGGDGISFPENEHGDLLVTYTVTSTYSQMLEDVSACAVFRDSDGDIIGASRPDDVGVAVDYPTGWSIRSLETRYGPPESIDEDRTEVYALP